MPFQEILKLVCAAIPFLLLIILGLILTVCKINNKERKGSIIPTSTEEMFGLLFYFFSLFSSILLFFYYLIIVLR
jgi:hypothetical protein